MNACATGGQAAAKDAMKQFTKAAGIKSCNQCHVKLAPTYELKDGALAQFKNAGGYLLDGTSHDPASRTSPMVTAPAACPANSKAGGIVAHALSTTRKVSIEKCVAANATTAAPGATSAWFFVAVAEDDNVKDDIDAKRYQHHVVLVGTGGALLGDQLLESYSELDRDKALSMRINSARAVDLNGDGSDEYIVETDEGRRDSQLTLRVFVNLNGSSLREALSVPFAYVNDSGKGAEQHCYGAWRVDGQRLVVVSKGGSSPAGCAPRGAMQYALKGNKFIESTTSDAPPPETKPAATSPKPSGNCDETSCVLKNYEGACCARFQK